MTRAWHLGGCDLREQLPGIKRPIVLLVCFPCDCRTVTDGHWLDQREGLTREKPLNSTFTLCVKGFSFPGYRQTHVSHVPVCEIVGHGLEVSIPLKRHDHLRGDSHLCSTTPHTPLQKASWSRRRPAHSSQWGPSTGDSKPATTSSDPLGMMQVLGAPVLHPPPRPTGTPRMGRSFQVACGEFPCRDSSWSEGWDIQREASS